MRLGCYSPILYVVSVSLTTVREVLRNGGFILFPREITFTAYRTLLMESNIPKAFQVTILITVIGTAVNLVLTGLMAYPLSRETLREEIFSSDDRIYLIIQWRNHSDLFGCEVIGTARFDLGDDFA